MNKAKKTDHKTDSTDIGKSIHLLEELAHNVEKLQNFSEAQRIALFKAAGKLAHPGRDEIKKRRKQAKENRRRALKKNDRQARAATGIRDARNAPVFTAPKQLPVADAAAEQEPPELSSPRNCYICKAEYTRLHHFYDAMCPACAEFNYQKRFQTAPMDGQVALITGSRVKIGFQTALMMLRAGATVIATTRFPVDSALRYSKEEDYDQWKHRLQIHGLDLRHTPSVEIFATWVEQNYDRLDVLINNAAQTVRRPPGFYAHLMANENAGLRALPDEAMLLLKDHEAFKSELKQLCLQTPDADANLPVVWHSRGPGIGIRSSAQLSQIPYSYDNSIEAKEVFPQGQLDVDLQQVDLRKTNSWRLVLGEVPATEMLEVQLVNAVAPFVLNNRLVNLMKRDYTGMKHIVNVTAMEGKFFRFKQAPRHPHTNMAKAALNMLTHTSAGELAKFGIYTNAVDTGWVTDEDPVELARFKEEKHDFQPPLDIVDGAARVCDPFFDGINTGKHWCGKFLKDYKPIDW